jgi:hypothetical protein
LALHTAAANAAFIKGAISFSDSFGTLPTVPTTSIVSELTELDIGSPILVSAPTDAFEDTSDATGYDFNINNLPTLFFETDTGFSFELEGAMDSRTPLSCLGALCADTLELLVTGVVSGAGFDDTSFAGVWTANGACTGSASECTGDISASWSVSLVATGEEPLPEPTTLGLFGFGLALAGIGYRRRRALTTG